MANSDQLPNRDRWGMPTEWNSGRPMGIYRPPGSFMLPIVERRGNKVVTLDLATLQREAKEAT